MPGPAGQMMPGLAGTMPADARALKMTAQSMSLAVRRTARRALAVSEAGREASRNIGMVAAAVEALAASLAGTSSRVTDRVLAGTQRTNKIVRALAEAGEKIGHMVQLITTIAGQINRLALDATAAASRGDDVGDGFAMVASEIKSLANQTAKATVAIGAQIVHIRSAMTEAFEAILGMAETIEAVTSMCRSIPGPAEALRFIPHVCAP